MRQLDRPWHHLDDVLDGARDRGRRVLLGRVRAFVLGCAGRTARPMPPAPRVRPRQMRPPRRRRRSARTFVSAGARRGHARVPVGALGCACACAACARGELRSGRRSGRLAAAGVCAPRESPWVARVVTVGRRRRRRGRLRLLPLGLALLGRALARRVLGGRRWRSCGSGDRLRVCVAVLQVLRLAAEGLRRRRSWLFGRLQLGFERRLGLGRGHAYDGSEPTASRQRSPRGRTRPRSEEESAERRKRRGPQRAHTLDCRTSGPRY